MFNWLAEKMNASATAGQSIMGNFDGETLLLATAATVIKTASRSTVGWSPERYRRRVATLLPTFQRRGNVVITDKRVYIRSSFASPFTIFWIVALVFGVARFAVYRDGTNLLLAAAASLFLYEHRTTFTIDQPLSGIDDAVFDTVWGIAGTSDLLAITSGDTTIQLVTAQKIPDAVRLLLTDVSVK